MREIILELSVPITSKYQFKFYEMNSPPSATYVLQLQLQLQIRNNFLRFPRTVENYRKKIILVEGAKLPHFKYFARSRGEDFLCA